MYPPVDHVLDHVVGARSRWLAQDGRCSENHTAICVREFTPSLFSKLWTGVSTVRTERNSRAAISLLLKLSLAVRMYTLVAG